MKAICSALRLGLLVAPAALDCRQPSRPCTKAGACNRPAKLQATGDAIASAGFAVDGLAQDLRAQHCAGRAGRSRRRSRSLLRRQPAPDSRARAIPSATTSPTCPCRPTAPIAAAGGIARSSRRPRSTANDERALAALRRHQLPRRSLAQRPQDRRFLRRSPAPIAPTTST